MSSTDIARVVVQLIDAENAMDASAAEALPSTDFTAITRARGVEQNRTALLAELAKPARQVTRQLEGPAEVLASDTLGIARSVVAVYEGTPPALTGRFRNIHVLTRYGVSWQCVAWQVTKLS
jgi:hypothetical protein